MTARRRDRHGRGPRGPLAWPAVPAMTTRRTRFDDLVLDAADKLRPHLGNRYAATEFAVQDVPPTDPAPWEEQISPLGRLLRADATRVDHVVVYRRPVEARAQDEADLADIVREVVTEQVAALLGVPAHELDPDIDPEA
ncbi:metallopeptidase family protein [Phycicoccus duodecadis]|uniref:Zinicin-like metallopeptidase n=1 Tax=Phycicoccus duodecadis TaxID=173053 RepID=A0A2N3YK18_9MICO|nr:metallopeptidase family protein [Phycicoccus duodecadis]PKW27196.1 zinicin-like metallopeptidase [Phycicoccus duodecadis]